MVLVRKQLKLNIVVAALATSAAALALPAWANGPHMPVADSTTNHVISVGVPLPVPPAVPGGMQPPVVPTGFHLVTYQSGPHWGTWPSDAFAPWAFANVGNVGTLGPLPCQAGAAPSTGYLQQTMAVQGQSATLPAGPGWAMAGAGQGPRGSALVTFTRYFVCEPVGTFTRLEAVTSYVP